MLVATKSSSISNRQIFLSLAAAAAKSLQSCPTLCDPIDGSPPSSPVPGILQARTLEWVAMLACGKLEFDFWELCGLKNYIFSICVVGWIYGCRVHRYRWPTVRANEQLNKFSALAITRDANEQHETTCFNLLNEQRLKTGKPEGLWGKGLPGVSMLAWSAGNLAAGMQSLFDQVIHF